MSLAYNRRQALTIGAGALAVASFGATIGPARAANDAQDLIKKFTGGKPATEGKVRLDLPEIAENGNTVPMTVTVDSPMTEQSHVTHVLIVADEQSARRRGDIPLLAGERRRRGQYPRAPGGDPEHHRGRPHERRLVLHDGEAGEGHDRRLRRLTGKDRTQETAMSVKPRIKLDKKQAKQGELVEVKALVSHVMETGQRKDAQGNAIPRKILNKFTCTVNGKQVFAADFEPAVSANPYIQFKFKAMESGPVVLTWTDDDGSTIIGEEAITVS